MKCRAYIAPGVRVTGHSTIGEKSWMGNGSTLWDHLNIGSKCITGAGAVVVEDFPHNVLTFGVPFKVIRSVNQGCGGA
jgi:serine acetyltransferase